MLPLPLDEGHRVERLAVERMRRAFTRPAEGASEFAVIDLANSSRHKPGVGTFTDIKLESALDRHDGDL